MLQIIRPFFRNTINGRIYRLLFLFICTIIGISVYVIFRLIELNNTTSKLNHLWQAELHGFITLANFQGGQFGVLNSIKKIEPDSGIYPKLIDASNNIVRNIIGKNLDSAGYSAPAAIDSLCNSIESYAIATLPVNTLIVQKQEKIKAGLSTSVEDSLIRATWQNADVYIGKFYTHLYGSLIFEVLSKHKLELRARLDELYLIIFISLLIIAVIITLFIIKYGLDFRKFIFQIIKGPTNVLDKLSSGEITELQNETKTELDSIILATNKLTENLTNASAFALEIGKGNFNHPFSAAGQNDVLGNALLKMKADLEQFSIKEKQQSWANSGYALFADLLRNLESDSKIYGPRMASEIANYLEVNQVFIFELDESKQNLDLIGAYAYSRQKYLQKQITVGVGLTGQAVLEEDIIFLTEIPNGYTKITSGLGDATPNCLLIVPIKDDKNIEGVIEIASFKVLQPFEIEFVQKLSQTLCSYISNMKQSQKMKQLLSETQEMAENLRSQEEEMRQNMEELLATQEQMERNK
ncbi:MAG: GAF domain-containing protein [Bacteroidota bacterium]|nr:GAF domain-containing protein [Bacteroidota bacterium]